MSEQPPALDPATLRWAADRLYGDERAAGEHSHPLSIASWLRDLAAQAEQQAATPPDVREVEARLTRMIATEFEGWGQAWWTDDSGDLLARVAARVAAGVLASTPRPEAAVIDADHLARQREWSERTFGPGTRLLGVLDHIRKELREIEADPTDVTEWIDVVILALDGAWRAGWEPQQIIDAIKAKQARNEARTWPDWREASPDHAIEHVREDTPRPEGETRFEWNVQARARDGSKHTGRALTSRAEAEMSAANLRRVWDIGGAHPAEMETIRVARRTVTSFPDVVGEWVPVEQDGDDRG